MGTALDLHLIISSLLTEETSSYDSIIMPIVHGKEEELLLIIFFKNIFVLTINNVRKIGKTYLRFTNIILKEERTLK